MAASTVSSSVIPQPQEINRLTDNQAWDLPDEVICDAALKSWRSTVYQHFALSLERQTDGNGERRMVYKFTCKINSKNHPAQFRARQGTASGTNNLQRRALVCDALNRAQNVVSAPAAARQFSYPRFRALLGLWCARNRRPSELVEDELFAEMIDELRPGTLVPDRTTLSRDIQSIYLSNLDWIRQYFEGVDHIHLVMDGWTAPTMRSYLGVVIIWQTSGELRRAVLEFIRLSHRHTGEYLAQQTASCLNKYGLGNKLLSVCMDNASNNDTFTIELQKLFPTFGGPSSRSRCAAHMVNLMAKAYLSVFAKPVSRKRSRGAKGAPRVQRKRRRVDPGVPATVEQPENEAEEADAGNDSDSEAEDAAEAFAIDNVDEDKAEYDETTVKASVELAFSSVEKKFGVKVPPGDRQSGQQVITKIAGLAKSVHKSAYIQHRFEEHVAKTPSLSQSRQRKLTRRVVTRWNTDLECIRSHLHFRPAVKLLTADRDLSLKRYQLTETQWSLAEQLVSELKLFERLTKLFSETQVPLIHQVVPALSKLQDRLTATLNSPAPSLHPLLRVAASAALEVFDKYMRLIESSSIYWIALVMCPHYKLEWFRNRKYSESDIARIEELVCSLFEHMSSADDEDSTSMHSKESSGLNCNNKQSLADDWLSDDELGDDLTPSCQDTIKDYLSSPLVPVEVLRHEGLLGYWAGQQKKRYRVAKFALNILSAPASSVDAERAFSGGRLTINHLQHSMSELTFEAKMAVGSWLGTPLLPSADAAAAVLKDKIRQ